MSLRALEAELRLSGRSEGKGNPNHPCGAVRARGGAQTSSCWCQLMWSLPSVTSNPFMSRTWLFSCNISSHTIANQDSRAVSRSKSLGERPFASQLMVVGNGPWATALWVPVGRGSVARAYLSAFATFFILCCSSNQTPQLKSQQVGL